MAEKTMDNVFVKVTISVTKKKDTSWGEADIIAQSTIEDASSATIDEIAEKIDNVVGDAVARAQAQLANTKRIKDLEQRNRLLADNPQ